MFLRRRESRAKPLTAAGILELLSPGSATHAGVAVTPLKALGLSAVWRAVSLLSGLVAGLPLRASGPGAPSSVPGAAGRLLANPHPSATAYELWERVMVHLLLAGNAYLALQRNGMGEIIALLPIDPHRVTPSLLDDGRKSYEVPARGSNTRIVVDDNVVLHIPGMGWDGVQGFGPITVLRQSLGAALAHEEFASRFFGSGSLLGGVLQTTEEVTAEQAAEYKARWREKVAGLAKAHEVAVLDRGLTFQPVSVSPEDAQFIEGRQFGVQDVARIFGLPPHLLADVAGSTSWGAGIAEQGRQLLTFTLQPWLARIEQRVATILPPGVEARFDTTELVRPQLLERYQAHTLALQGGWLTVDEVREAEGLGPAPTPMPTEPLPALVSEGNGRAS